MNTTQKTKVRDDYLKLIYEFPLRAIRSDAEHARGIEVITRLMMRPQSSLTSGERDYLGVLADLIEQYEKRVWPRPADTRPPHEKIANLMERTGMTQVDLAALLGVKQPMASLLLHGKRELTAAYIKKLSDHFALRAEYFMPN